MVAEVDDLRPCAVSDGVGEENLFVYYSERTRRNPRLLLRLSGVLLLRFDVRQFLALLFQLPPRLTRLELLLDYHPIFLSIQEALNLADTACCTNDVSGKICF